MKASPSGLSLMMKPPDMAGVGSRDIVKIGEGEVANSRVVQQGVADYITVNVVQGFPVYR